MNGLFSTGGVVSGLSLNAAVLYRLDVFKRKVDTALPVRQHDGIGVRVQYRHQRIGFYESPNLVQYHRPFVLVLRLVGARIVGYMSIQFDYEIAYQLHASEEEADYDEASVVTEFLYHQLRSRE